MGATCYSKKHGSVPENYAVIVPVVVETPADNVMSKRKLTIKRQVQSWTPRSSMVLSTNALNQNNWGSHACFDMEHMFQTNNMKACMDHVNGMPWRYPCMSCMHGHGKAWMTCAWHGMLMPTHVIHEWYFLTIESCSSINWGSNTSQWAAKEPTPQPWPLLLQLDWAQIIQTLACSLRVHAYRNTMLIYRLSNLESRSLYNDTSKKSNMNQKDPTPKKTPQSSNLMKNPRYVCLGLFFWFMWFVVAVVYCVSFSSLVCRFSFLVYFSFRRRRRRRCRCCGRRGCSCYCCRCRRHHPEHRILIFISR